MDSSETLRYWRYARLQLAAEGQALRRSCRYDVRPHPAGRPLGPSPSGRLSICPLMRGAFFRVIRRCVCEFGGLAALGLTATKRDWEMGRIEVQLTLDHWQHYVVALMATRTGAVLLAAYGNPGGHALGAQRAGLPVVLLDIAQGPAIADAQRYFSAPRNRSPLVHVVSGDATDRAVCEAAIAAHPTHNDHIATFGTPPCSPTSTGNVTGEGIDGTRADGRHRQSEQCAGTCVMQLQAELEEQGRPFFVETTLGGRKVVGKYAATSRLPELAFAIRSGGSHVIAYNENHPYFEEERLKRLHLFLRPITCAGPRPLPPLGPDGVPLEVFQEADGSYRSCCSGQLLCLWGRGPKFSGLTLAEVSEMVGFDKGHVTSMNRLCDALPPAPSQLLSSQLAAHTLRIRNGIPIITEAEACRDPPLGAWLLRLLGLAPWSDVPLPIVRCVLVCCPRIFPGSVLMAADGSLPVVSLPRFGASLVTQVASTFAATYSALSGDPAHYHFVCDGLGAVGGASMVFYSTFVPDLHSHLLEPLVEAPLATSAAATARSDSRWRDERGRVCTSRVVFAEFGGAQVWCARRSDTRTLDALSVVQTATDSDALAACSSRLPRPLRVALGSAAQVPLAVRTSPAGGAVRRRRARCTWSRPGRSTRAALTWDAFASLPRGNERCTGPQFGRRASSCPRRLPRRVHARLSSRSWQMGRVATPPRSLSRCSVSTASSALVAATTKRSSHVALGLRASRGRKCGISSTCVTLGAPPRHPGSVGAVARGRSACRRGDGLLHGGFG